MSNSNGENQPQVMQVIQGPEAQAYHKKKKKQAATEFKEWKGELCKIVNRESRIVMMKDGSYKFILPEKLVKLVWATTFEERMRAIMAGGNVSLEDAKGRALREIRTEMDEAHTEFSGEQPSEVDQAKHEQEEREAQDAIDKMRAELVRKKDNA